ncbi:DoxX family membrane protein [bacterium]|nr:DoxX family membrane protein [bacterium]
MATLLAQLNESRYANIFLTLLRIGLGALFIYASLDKIWNPGLFAKVISNYRILPLPLLHLSAIILPWLELLCGLALVFNRYARAANILIAGMLFVFILAIVASIYRGLDFNCGCFKLEATEKNMGTLKIIENLAMLGITGLLEYRFRIGGNK